VKYAAKVFNVICSKPVEPRRRLFLAGDQKGVNSMANQSLDARRIAREQESRIAAAASVGLNAAKPMFQFQTSVLRLWADNFEMLARNCEHGVEAFTTAIEQQHDQARQQAAE
jgi:hypothetical protein